MRQHRPAGLNLSLNTQHLQAAHAKHDAADRFVFSFEPVEAGAHQLFVRLEYAAAAHASYEPATTSGHYLGLDLPGSPFAVRALVPGPPPTTLRSEGGATEGRGDSRGLSLSALRSPSFALACSRERRVVCRIKTSRRLWQRYYSRSRGHTLD